MKNTNLFLSEKELSRAKALEEKLLNYIQTHNIKRDQCNKYSKKLRISKSDKNLLNLKSYYLISSYITKYASLSAPTETYVILHSVAFSMYLM